MFVNIETPTKANEVRTMARKRDRRGVVNFDVPLEFDTSDFADVFLFFGKMNNIKYIYI